ncbi:hypothetical protein AGROH133_03981 [Agrobacterium tumefaciens]|nr:hypothetical protein AGROH133_03981 [Agrobacterium tumefaciens]
MVFFKRGISDSFTQAKRFTFSLKMTTRVFE